MAIITDDPTYSGFGVVDGDFITEDPAYSGFGVAALKVAGFTTDQAYQSSLWSVSETHSLRVPPGETATVALTGASTAVIVARNSGQQMTVDATTVTSVSSDETMRAEGSTLVTLGEGWWDNLTLVAGSYSGPTFYGPPWAGIPDASMSTYNPYLPHPISLYGASWLIDQDIRLSDSRLGFTLGRVTGASADMGVVTVTALGRLSDLNVYNVNAQPFIGTLEGAFEYYLSLAGETTDLFVDASVASRPVALRGFSGELWFYLKQLAMAQECEIALVSGVILLRPIRSRVGETGKFTQVQNETGMGQLAQTIEVYWYDTTAITNGLIYPPGGWTPEVDVLNVNAGETTEYQLELSASVSSIVDPTMLTFVAEDENSASVYTVVADDGFPVPAVLWTANGGSLSVTINPDTVSLTVSLTGASNIPTATGEYSKAFSLALASDTSGSRYSTLRILGTGVSYTREKRVFRTGVPASRTATAVGATIDNPFLTNLNDLYHAGSRAAAQYSGLVPSLTGSITAINRRGDSGSAAYPTYAEVESALETELGSGFTYSDAQTYYLGEGFTTYAAVEAYWFSTVANDFENQAFGNVAGARLWHARTKRWYRVRSATLGPDVITFNAEDDLVYEDVQNSVTGQTYADVQLTRNTLTYQQERMAGLIG